MALCGPSEMTLTFVPEILSVEMSGMAVFLWKMG
jgi:flagellar biosynthesis protein FliQ